MGRSLDVERYLKQVSAAEFFGVGAAGGRRLRDGGTLRTGPEGAADTLESEENNVLSGGQREAGGSRGGGFVSELVFVPDRCGCRLCRECGSMLGRKLRRRLHEKAGLFKAPRMISLTVDLKGTKTGRGFDSAAEAHAFVTGGRYIAKLMAKLGRRVWVWVLEFQRSGNPHWHVLFDASDLPGEQFDYRLVWRWWRENWKIGGFKASEKSSEFDCPEHALNYITKYIVKEPEDGYPDWVWEAGRRMVRFVGASKEVGRLVRREEDPGEVDQGGEVEVEGSEDGEELDQGEEEAGAERKLLPYRERVRRCCSSVKALRHRVDDQGVESWEHVGGLGVSWVQFQQMVMAGLVPGVGLSAEPVLSAEGGDTGLRRLRVKGRAGLHVSDLERQVKRGLLMGGGELQEEAERRGVRFEADGGWALRKLERVA